MQSIGFLRDEVRNGFYIPTAIKQAWAAALDVLAEIDRICKKYGIRYFAEWGTLLGAVRHSGFVPWDDDIDISLMREDFERFFAVADEELPKEYAIHSYETKADHRLFLRRVVNNSKICFEEKYLEEHYNFPWLVGVDVFAKDYLYKDEEKERERDQEIMKLISIADGLIDGTLRLQTISLYNDEIETRYGLRISEDQGTQGAAAELYHLAEQQMGRVKPEEADYVGQMFPWVLKNGTKAGEPKKCYEELIDLPFEGITVPVPKGYDEVLTSRYGEYRICKKGGAIHNYPFFEEQRKDLEEIAGEKLPVFTFDRSMLERSEPERNRSLKATVSEYTEAVENMLYKAERMLAEKDLQGTGDVLVSIQELTIDLGTLIEQVKGANHKVTAIVTRDLQDLCETLYEAYQLMAECGEEGRTDTGRKHESGQLSEGVGLCRLAFKKIEESLKVNILQRKEILFLPVGGKEWLGLEDIYEMAAKESDTDVYIVPLPLVRKDYFGRVMMTEEEIAESVHADSYPETISVKDWINYDLSLHCPDAIYIQNPYDGENPCLTVPEAFYTKKMQPYADRIIYIPIAKTEEFGSEDAADQYNMKHYVTTPGVVYADEVLVQSQNIREQYINTLVRFAGEDTRTFWEDKIRVLGDNSLLSV